MRGVAGNRLYKYSSSVRQSNHPVKYKRPLAREVRVMDIDLFLRSRVISEKNIKVRLIFPLVRGLLDLEALDFVQQQMFDGGHFLRFFQGVFAFFFNSIEAKV